MTAALPVTGNTEVTAPENRAFYPALDGLRALAFLMVFATHYLSLPWGWGGVNFFFVLSGFLITGILYDTKDAPHRARNFYMRRTLRIFPLYYAVLLAAVLLWPMAHWLWNWKWLLWAAYLGNFAHFSPMPAGSPAQQLGDFQLNGFILGHRLVLYLGHFWSLCIEEQFYLVWPWIVFWLRDRRKLLWICGLALPIGVVLRILSQVYLPPWMVAENVLSRFTPLSCDALLVGGFIALLLRGPHKAALLRAASWALPPYLIACALWLLLWRRLHSQAGSYPYPNWTETFGFTVLDILGVLLMMNALQPGNWVYRALHLRPLRWAGRISYGAYVLHDIPHQSIWRFAGLIWPSHERRTGIALALVWTYGAAWLSFRFLESPFLNLKERWTLRT